MARAHDESLNKSRRLSAAWVAKRANADKKKLTSQCPRWMRFNPDSEEFELIPERVAVIREIMEWHKAGLGRTYIVKRLNDRKEPVWKSLTARKAQVNTENELGEVDEQEAKGWHSSYVHRIISNPAIYGELQMQAMKDGVLQPVGEPIPDYYPAVITKEEYYLLENITSEVILGARNHRTPEKVANLVSKNLSDVTVFKTRPAFRRFAMTRDRLTPRIIVQGE